MTTILVSLGLIITYFIITAIKEGEARETIERERKINSKKIANIHFENLVTKELERQKIIEESRSLFIKEIEKEETIKEAFFEENALIIVTENYINAFDANEYATTLMNLFVPSTGVDKVKILDPDGFTYGYAKRN